MKCEKPVLKEIIVEHYFYIMEGVFEKGSFPHIFSKDEIEKNFRLDYELNCFENIVKWWKLYCRNHDATCEYMTCTAVLSNGNKYLIHDSELAGLFH